ncbi:MAG: phospholipase [Pirellulales bacterium]|nr:phospholipase [Pirellulales bacterium]
MSTPTIDLEILRTLHRLHRQLSDVRERLDRGPKQIKAAEANAAHRQTLLEQARTDEKAFRVALDQKQLQFKGAEVQVKDLEIKRNTAQSNREYQLLTEQIQATRMANDVLADEILEALDRTEQYKDRIRQAEAELSAAKGKLDKVQTAFCSEEPQLKEKMKQLETELKTAEESLPPEIREPYRRVVRQRGEDALASVENQSCSGCHQKIPLNTYSLILVGQPIFCKTCGRMLYTPEGHVREARKEEE